jgi:hypothetical protein
MRPVFQTFPRQSRAFAITGLVVACAAAIAAGAPLVQKQLSAAPNIFSLVGSLHGTTAKILTNTRDLGAQVNQVESKLSDLTQQEQILNQQTATGQALASQLQTQVALTSHNLDLMRQILTVEQATTTVTNELPQKSSLLASQIGGSANVLNSLDSTLATTSTESNALNAQMDTLLSELQSSQQEFRVFGQVNQLLRGLNPGVGNPAGLLSKPLKSLTGALSGNALTGNVLSPASSALGSVTNAVGGVLSSSSKTPSNQTQTTSTPSLLGILGGN